MNANELTAFRTQLQACQQCFEGTKQKCRHHEDLLGGYDKGKIVFIGINPQGADGNDLYLAVEAGTGEQRNLLGDEILKLFSGEQETSRSFPELDFTKHLGLKTWLPLACKRLGLTPTELTHHVRFVEAYKHTTANESELRNQPELWGRIERTCPDIWLRRQLEELEPRLLIFSGNAGLKILSKWAGTCEGESISETTAISAFHGKEASLTLGGRPYQCLLTFGISGSANGAWSGDPRGSLAVQTAVRRFASLA